MKKTYNINMKYIIKTKLHMVYVVKLTIFATFQQPYL